MEVSMKDNVRIEFLMDKVNKSIVLRFIRTFLFLGKVLHTNGDRFEGECKEGLADGFGKEILKISFIFDLCLFREVLFH